MENETVLKLTDTIASEMLAKFNSPEFKAFIKSVNDSTDTGTFEMVISTDNIDRHGEIVDQKGIDYANYMQNPVVLWGHNHNQIPVGVTDQLYTRVVGSQTQTVAKGRFAPHEFAQTLRQLFDLGMLKTSSIGFIPKEYNGKTITKSELLEWSFVSIPANPYALALGKSGFNVVELLEKGVITESIKHGDDVQTDVVIEPETDDTVIPAETETKPDEVVETPADEVTAPVQSDEEKETEETKGAIADTVAEQDAYKLKWDNFKVIDKLFWAFCEVYFDDSTPVEDFETLKLEFISLVSGTVVDSRLNNDIDVETVKAKHAGQIKAGRVLSSSNREKITSAISALEEVLQADTSDTPDEVATNGVQGNGTDVSGVEDFMKLRKNVQSLAGVLTSVLAESKKTAQRYGVDVRHSN